MMQPATIEAVEHELAAYQSSDLVRVAHHRGAVVYVAHYQSGRSVVGLITTEARFDAKAAAQVIATNLKLSRRPA